jgi:hypothetical protein
MHNVKSKVKFLIKGRAIVLAYRSPGGPDMSKSISGHTGRADWRCSIHLVEAPRARYLDYSSYVSIVFDRQHGTHRGPFISDQSNIRIPQGRT